MPSPAPQYDVRFATQPVAYTSVPRFRADYWTTNYPITSFGAVVSSGLNQVTLTAVLNTYSDFVGLQFYSDDTYSHPLLKYASNYDYSGITFTFQWVSSTNLPGLSDPAYGPNLTIQYTDGTFAYVRLQNYVQSGGTDWNAQIILNFDTMHSGFNSSDPSWAPVRSTVIKQMFFGAVPVGYSNTSTTPLPATINGTISLQSMVVTSNVGTSPNATMLLGSLPGSPVSLGNNGLANDYDSSYPITPKRLVREITQLGYTSFDHYMGPLSKSMCIKWSSTEGRFILDPTLPLNAAFTAYHTDLFNRLLAAGIPLISGVSFEIWTPYCPLNWGQLDINGNIAQTGYNPSTTYARFMDPAVAAYLKLVAVALANLVPSGLDYTYQIAERAWWSGQFNGPSLTPIGPCIYDPAIQAAYVAAGHTVPLTITSYLQSPTSTELAYIHFCRDQLGAYTIAELAAVKAARSGTKGSALWYADAILNTSDTNNGIMTDLDLPSSYWVHPAFDTMEVENYGQETPTFLPGDFANLLSVVTGSGGIDLNYPLANINYYVGIATNPNATITIAAYFYQMVRALNAAETAGVGKCILWSWTQLRDTGAYFIQTGAIVPDLTQTNYLEQFVEGELVAPADLVSIQSNIDNAIGELIEALGGPDLAFASGSTPLVISPIASTMTANIGGTGQKVIAQGRLLDVCPTTVLTFATAGGSDRVDTVCLQATRVTSSSSVLRNVRPDGTGFPVQVLQATLVAGSVTVNLPSGFSGAYPVASPIGAGTGSLSVQTSGSTVTVLSTNSADTRTVNILMLGTVANGAGTPTTINMLQNQPSYVVVTGTSTTPPAPPSGYEAFAHVYIHASETSISGGDITYLFPQLAQPTNSPTFQNLTVTTTTILNTLQAAIATITGNATVSGTLGVTGTTTLGALIAAATTLSSLHVTGTTGLDGTVSFTGAATMSNTAFNVTVATTLAALNAAATTLLSLAVTNNATIGGTLGVTGNTTLGGTLGVTGATTLSSGSTSGNFTVGGTLVAIGTSLTKFGPHVANTQTQTLTMDAPLPTGNWRVVAHANFNMNGSSTVTLSGIDGGTTWETSQSTNDTDQPNNADLWLTGTAVGGNQPEIQLQSTLSSTPYVGYLGILEIRATRTS